MKFSKNITLKQKIIGIIFIGIIFTILSYLSEDNSKGTLTGGVIKRPEPGQAAVNHDIEITDDKGNVITSTSISINPRTLKADELENYFNEAEVELEEGMLGNNKKLSEVRTNLNLMTELCNGIFSVDWYTDNYSVVDYNGTVHNQELSDDETMKVRIVAMVSYEDEKREFGYDVTVMAPVRNEKEQLEAEVIKNIAKTLEETGNEETIELPDNANGMSVLYREHRKRQIPIFFVLSIAAAVLVVFNEKNKKLEAENNRIKQMTLDYSEVVSKLTLLMGAGMTVRRAWAKIVEDYLKNRNEKGERYIYEEMYETKCVIESGVAETAAYERFGRKCNTKEYLKLASLLQANVKKGTKELAFLLEQEALEAFDKRKNLAKQKGEEASTKLLVPMVIMLVIVMVIVMVPAIKGFMI